jgi:hypothetical protein
VDCLDDALLSLIDCPPGIAPTQSTEYALDTTERAASPARRATAICHEGFRRASFRTSFARQPNFQSGAALRLLLHEPIVRHLQNAAKALVTEFHNDNVPSARDATRFPAVEQRERPLWQHALTSRRPAIAKTSRWRADQTDMSVLFTAALADMF